ncbi:hypothetical protein MTR67_051876 [Solanum verrucosum]|uniref:Integrase zinc-binding domain-containing protein n=1 Tax=Solanum verrucosum TaxID=315347 RepID=A0AAF0V851_SOLVR|nr:hypothetical protein MTR67_051876 [Solanum verrucosum]
MHRYLREIYWWNVMKKHIAGFVAKCQNCQQGVMRFGKKGKLSPRYIGPYQILRNIGKVSYQLDLPNGLATGHQVFHVSMLMKCVGDQTSIVPIEGLELMKVSLRKRYWLRS